MKRRTEASSDSSKIKEKRNKSNNTSAKVVDIGAYLESTSEANIITELQNNSIDLNMIDNKNITLYMYSADKGYFDLFNYLHSNIKVKKDLLSKEGETIIHFAARGGNKYILYALLENFTNIDIKDINGNTPLHLAACQGNIEVVKLLLADPRVNPAACDKYTICEAAFMGHIEIIRLLLADSRFNPAAYNNGAIRWAASMGHTEVVKLLMENKAVNSNIDYNSLAKIALDKKNNNLYATLESFNPANKGLLTVWTGKKDLDSIISILPEETIKEEIIQNYFVKKQLAAKTI